MTWINKEILPLALSVLYAGCQTIPSAPENASPSPTPTATRELSGIEMYGRIWDKLDSQKIVYNYLLGDKGRETDNGYDPFYKDGKEYRRFNGGSLPCTIGFTLGDGGGLILAKCDGFMGDNVFQLFEGRDPGANICAPVVDPKIDLYRKLLEGFRFGQEVDRDLIRSIMRGATPDCGYFLELERGGTISPTRHEFVIRG